MLSSDESGSADCGFAFVATDCGFFASTSWRKLASKVSSMVLSGAEREESIILGIIFENAKNRRGQKWDGNGEWLCLVCENKEEWSVE